MGLEKSFVSVSQTNLIFAQYLGSVFLQKKTLLAFCKQTRAPRRTPQDPSAPGVHPLYFCLAIAPDILGNQLLLHTLMDHFPRKVSILGPLSQESYHSGTTFPGILPFWDHFPGESIVTTHTYGPLHQESHHSGTTFLGNQAGGKVRGWNSGAKNHCLFETLVPSNFFRAASGN